MFFNHGCPACWEDFPILAELSQEVTIVLLVVGELSPEEFGRLRTVASEKVMVLLVKDFKVLEAYQVVRSPTYFLVDEKGVVIWVKEGNLVLGVVEKVREVLNAVGNPGYWDFGSWAYGPRSAGQRECNQ